MKTPSLRTSRLAILLLGALALPSCNDSGGGQIADLDSDGIADEFDLDIDGDGVANALDAFPRNRLEFYDTDGDGVGNLQQLDEDRDGVPDLDDAFPFDPTRSVAAEFAEQGFNDNLGTANATSPLLVGATTPPTNLPIEQRFVRIAGTIAPAFDTDVYLIAPPTDGPVSIVLRCTDPSRSAEQLRLGVVALDGSSRVTRRIENTALEGTAGIWGSFGNEVLGLVVNDLGGATEPIPYLIEFAVDADHDGVGDQREQAIGARIDAIDSDRDGLTDLDESLGLTDFDPDLDVAPTWLDRDSDGDGWPDAVESALDCDQDGLPNFVDTDADGNDVPDSAEPADSGALLDTDGDGALNAFDLDDDNDGLLDRDDASPPVPAMILEASDGGLYGRYWRLNGTRIDEVARPQGMLRLRGDALGSSPETRFVAQFTRTKDRRGRAWVEAAVQTVTGGELESVVPGDAASGEVRLLDTVAGRVTRSLPLRILDADAPVILTQSLRSTPGQNVTLSLLDGPTFPGGLTIQLNGSPIAPQFVSQSFASFTLPADATSGALLLASSFGHSNSIPVAITRSVPSVLTMPAGSPASEPRTVVVGAFSQPLAIGTATSFSLTLPAGEPMLVSVHRTTGDATPLLLAVADPAVANCALSVASTATALVWSAADRQLTIRRDPATRRTLLQIVQNASELPQLTLQLQQTLSLDPNALAALPATLRDQILATADAAIASLPAALPVTGGNSRYMIAPESAFGFTPKEDNALFRLENDTLLFASAALFELNSSGIVIGQRTPHVTSYFSAALIQPQNGAPFFGANTTPIPSPTATRTLLQVISAGQAGNTSTQPIDPGAYQAVIGRTLLSQYIVPVVAQATGGVLGDEQVLLSVLVDTIGPTIENALTNYQRGFGTLTGTMIAVLDAVIADVSKPLTGETSAILTALTKRYGQSLGSAAATAVARAVIKKLAALLTLYDLLSTTINSGALAYDLNDKPSGIDFLITSDLQIDQLTPVRTVNYHWGTQEWDVPLRVIGTGMVPRDGYQAWQSAPSLVQVSIDGRSSAADSILSDGTSTIVVLRQEDVERLTPGTASVEVEVDFVLTSNRLDLEVFDRPVVDRLSPSTGRPGDVIEIAGIGFDPRAPAANEVEFTGTPDPVYGEVLDVTPDGRRLTVRVPVEVNNGPVKVSCERPDGTRVDANEVFFSLATSTITYWDSGNLKDDIFALYLDGQVLQQPSSPVFPPITTEVALEPDRVYEVLLFGVSAPDQIGTYTIEFSAEIEVLAGSDALSGNDLIANAVKYYSIRIPGSGSSPTAAVLWQDPNLPRWFETGTAAPSTTGR